MGDNLHEYLNNLIEYHERLAITDDHGTCSYQRLLEIIYLKQIRYSHNEISTYMLTPEPSVDSITTILALVLCRKSLILCSKEDLKALSKNQGIHFLPVTASSSENLFVVHGPFPDNKLLLLTSGTSGNKKLVQMNFMNLIKNARDVLELYPLTSSNTVLSILPLFHVFGLVSLLGVLTIGGHIVIGNRATTKFLHQPECPYIVHSVPSVLADILPIISKQAVQQVLSAGAPLSCVIADKYQQLGIPVFEAYGLTEACGAVAIGPFKQMKILPTRDAFFCVNQIFVSDDLADCYWGEEPFEECFPTGDLGEILPWDILSITGRLKEIIVLPNGEKIHPTVLEDKLLAVSGIKEAEVFQYADGTIVAELYTVEAEQTIKEEVEKLNRDLPKFLQIKGYNIHRCPLEKTETGKLKRRQTLWKKI